MDISAHKTDISLADDSLIEESSSFDSAFASSVNESIENSVLQ